MLHSIKMHVALLGISLLFAEVVLSAPSSVNSTAETHNLAEISVAVPVDTTASLSAETEEGVVNASGLVAMKTAAATTSDVDPQVLHTSTAVTTSAGATHPSQNATIIETAKPTEDQMHQQSPFTSADVAPAVTMVTVAVSSLRATSTAEVASSSTSAANPNTAQAVIQNTSSSSASTKATPTPETTPVFDPTTAETSTSTERLSMSQSDSVTRSSTSQFPYTTGSNSSSGPSAASISTHSPIITSVSTTVSSTNIPSNSVSTTVSSTNIPSTSVFTTVSSTNIPSTSVSTTVSSTNIPSTSVPTTVSSTNIPSTSVSTINVSTSPAALIPDATLSTKTTTAAPCDVSEKPPSTKVQPCSTRNIAKNCLITIASLAVLATIFMVSTIILCTKLSSRKYKVKNAQPATEMMCISALLPETNYTYSRQRNPVSNGVLVIHGGADSDEEGGDNLTLSSFLPENDRFV